MDFLPLLHVVGGIFGLIFFLLMGIILIPQFVPVFVRKHGFQHRFFGFLYLIAISCGFWSVFYIKPFETYVIFDIILGLLGIALTLSAASEFRYHKHARNIASGTLDDKATVTYDEMIEHSFYQVLNLIQIIYLHLISFSSNMELYEGLSGQYSISTKQARAIVQLILLILCVSPWLFRGKFPVNKFSDNYLKQETVSTPLLIHILYRIKKYQYLLYKHWLLHGLNITIAFLSFSNISASYITSSIRNQHLSSEPSFRLYWILLNTAYVMEFFMQTLVKKKFLKQDIMLWLQKILMLASTCAALPIVLYHVNPLVASASLILNWNHRKHEFLNTSLIIAVALAYQLAIVQPSI